MSTSAKTLAAWGLVGLGAGVFGATLVFATVFSPQEPELPAPPQAIERAAALAEDLPARLRIPALSIDAKVQHVGLTQNGQMANPNNFTDVGWYKYGTAPGERGSAVMAGHVDNGLSLPGVFKKLNEAKRGDEIEVESADGTIVRFVITDVVVYEYEAAPAETIFNRADKARLNLITCDGAWLAGERTYDKRLVVYAERAD